MAGEGGVGKQAPLAVNHEIELQLGKFGCKHFLWAAPYPHQPETSVTEVKPVEEKTDKAEAAPPHKEAAPASGMFGFAGSTLFQPGNSGFDPQAQHIPFKPKVGEKPSGERKG